MYPHEYPCTVDHIRRKVSTHRKFILPMLSHSDNRTIREHYIEELEITIICCLVIFLMLCNVINEVKLALYEYHEFTFIYLFIYLFI